MPRNEFVHAAPGRLLSVGDKRKQRQRRLLCHTVVPTELQSNQEHRGSPQSIEKMERAMWRTPPPAWILSSLLLK